MIDLLNHILLEVFCLKDIDRNADKPLPACCVTPNTPSYECLQKKCPFLDFTSCENTLCYINEKSEMEAGILFGGDMDSGGDHAQNLNLWKSISIDAVNLSYETYMMQKKSD